MRTRYTINVTQEIIDESKRCNYAQCMVAEAIRQQVPGADTICVDIRQIRFSLLADRTRLFYLTPLKVSQYVEAYDAGDDIRPFSFQIRAPHAEMPMRPRIDLGEPKQPPDKKKGTLRMELAMQKEGGGFTGKTIVKHDAPIPRALTRRMPYARHFGRRYMRINQQDAREN